VSPVLPRPLFRLDCAGETHDQDDDAVASGDEASGDEDDAAVASGDEASGDEDDAAADRAAVHPRPYLRFGPCTPHNHPDSGVAIPTRVFRRKLVPQFEHGSSTFLSSLQPRRKND